MRTVTKVFNNNIVHAVGHDGEDVILVGAGIGFRASRGDAVNEERVEREFHPTGLVPSGAFRVLLDLPTRRSEPSRSRPTTSSAPTAPG